MHYQAQSYDRISYTIRDFIGQLPQQRIQSCDWVWWIGALNGWMTGWLSEWFSNCMRFRWSAPLSSHSNWSNRTQTAVVWSCFPFIRSGQNHLARHSERGKKTRWTKEEVGRQHQGMDKPGVQQVPEGSRKQGKNGENWLQNHLWCPNNPRG